MVCRRCVCVSFDSSYATTKKCCLLHPWDLIANTGFMAWLRNLFEFKGVGRMPDSYVGLRDVSVGFLASRNRALRGSLSSKIRQISRQLYKEGSP